MNLIVLALAVAMLAGAAGWVIGHNRATPDPTAVDIGFLQDMRARHDQAVQMSFILLAAGDSDPRLQVVARSIVVGQGLESGRMLQMLDSFGAPESNVTDQAMAWMGEPVQVDLLPGMASNADLTTFANASGSAADALFIKLMTAHHQGGIHMADFAAQHAEQANVRLLARQMASSQADEIDELAQLQRVSG